MYEHFIYGPSTDALKAVATDLAAAGYLVPDPPRLGAGCDPAYGDGADCSGCEHHWVLIVFGEVERAFADGGRDDISAACERHGAFYDGGDFSISEPDVADLVKWSDQGHSGLDAEGTQ